MNDKNNEKREYKTPELSRLGSVGSLTASGSGPKTENTGNDDKPYRQVRA